MRIIKANSLIVHLNSIYTKDCSIYLDRLYRFSEFPIFLPKFIRVVYNAHSIKYQSSKLYHFNIMSFQRSNFDGFNQIRILQKGMLECH